MTAIAEPRFTILPVPKPRVSHRPYAVLAALQILDVLTTAWLLYNFVDAEEGNPIVDAIFSTVGLGTGLGILLALKLAVVYVMWNCQSKVRLVSVLYTAVVANNLLFLILLVLR